MTQANTDIDNLLQTGTEDESFVIRYHQIDASDCNKFPRQTILFHVNHQEEVFDVYWTTWSPEHEDNMFDKKEGRKKVIERMDKAEDTPFHLHNIPYQRDLSLRGNLLFALEQLRNDLFDYADGYINLEDIRYVDKVHENTERELNRFTLQYIGISFTNAMYLDWRGKRFENGYFQEVVRKTTPDMKNIYESSYSRDVNGTIDDFIENVKGLWLRYVQVPIMKVFS